MLRKKWERTFLVMVLAMTMSLTPVSAFGSEAFTDGGEVGKADGSADSFVEEDLLENVFDDGVGKSGGNVGDRNAVFLCFPYTGIHEYRTAGAKIGRVAGGESQF